MKEWLANHRPGLGTYLAIAFSALSVLLTATMMAVIERTASDQVGASIGSSLTELARQTTSRLDRSMFERYREVQLMAGRLGPDTDGARSRAEIDASQKTYPNYAWIGITDLQGIVQIASGGLLVGADVSKRPWWSNALKGNYVGDLHDALLLAKLLQPGGGEPMRFVDIAFPLQGEGGAMRGVLGVHLSWRWASELRDAVFSRSGRSAQVEPFILSSGGVVLLGPPASIGQKLDLASFRRASQGASGFEIERWPDGREYLVGYSPTRGHQSYPGLGWVVLVREDVHEAFAPVRELHQRVLTGGIILAVLFSLLGWLVARAITRPVLQLADEAHQVEQGQVTAVRPSAAYREVGTLGTALNAVLGNLKRKEDELRELNAGLEQRVRDRTAELQQALETVRASEQRTQTIIEASPDPFIGMDLQGNITDWNSEAEAVFGWPREDVIGRSVIETLVPSRFESAFRKALGDFLVTGSTGVVGRPIERILRTREGRDLPVEMRVALVSTGQHRFFSAFVQDITQRKEVERMKDEFIATASHELRTPLTSIYGSLNLLQRGVAGELTPKARELVGVSARSAERLLRLVNDMLDVEKMRSGRMDYKMERLPLRPLVEQAMRDIRAFADSRKVELRFEGGPEATVNVDGDRIVQVLVNLMSNAVKFSPEGGAVDVSVTPSAGAVRVAVVDHGPGIPPEFASRIFQRFSQADTSDRRAKGGTGLGLSITRSIVEAHHGTIAWTSEPGVRTEFFFELPLA